MLTRAGYKRKGRKVVHGCPGVRPSFPVRAIGNRERPRNGVERIGNDHVSARLFRSAKRQNLPDVPRIVDRVTLVLRGVPWGVKRVLLRWRGFPCLRCLSSQLGRDLPQRRRAFLEVPGNLRQ